MVFKWFRKKNKNLAGFWGVARLLDLFCDGLRHLHVQHSHHRILKGAKHFFAQKWKEKVTWQFMLGLCKVQSQTLIKWMYRSNSFTWRSSNCLLVFQFSVAGNVLAILAASLSLSLSRHAYFCRGLAAPLSQTVGYSRNLGSFLLRCHQLQPLFSTNFYNNIPLLQEHNQQKPIALKAGFVFTKSRTCPFRRGLRCSNASWCHSCNSWTLCRSPRFFAAVWTERNCRRWNCYLKKCISSHLKNMPNVSQHIKSYQCLSFYVRNDRKVVRGSVPFVSVKQTWFFRSPKNDQSLDWFFSPCVVSSTSLVRSRPSNLVTGSWISRWCDSQSSRYSSAAWSWRVKRRTWSAPLGLRSTRNDLFMVKMI